MEAPMLEEAQMVVTSGSLRYSSFQTLSAKQVNKCGRKLRILALFFRNLHKNFPVLMESIPSNLSEIAFVPANRFQKLLPVIRRAISG